MDQKRIIEIAAAHADRAAEAARHKEPYRSPVGLSLRAQTEEEGRRLLAEIRAAIGTAGHLNEWAADLDAGPVWCRVMSWHVPGWAVDLSLPGLPMQRPVSLSTEEVNHATE